MRRWLDRLTALVLTGSIVVTLLACWMPAYVGVTPRPEGPRWHWPRRQLNRPAAPAPTPAPQPAKR